MYIIYYICGWVKNDIFTRTGKDCTHICNRCTVNNFSRMYEILYHYNTYNSVPIQFIQAREHIESAHPRATLGH